MTTTYDPKLHKIVSRELIENLLAKSKSEAGSFKVKNFGKEADCTTIDGALTYGRSQAYAVSHLMLSAAPEITLNQWQPIETCPLDGTKVLRPHVTWGAITVRHKRPDHTEEFLRGYNWMNFDYSNLWPDEAFLPYWMPLTTIPTPPEN